jgi:hypothetical protein
MVVHQGVRCDSAPFCRRRSISCGSASFLCSESVRLIVLICSDSRRVSSNWTEQSQ